MPEAPRLRIVAVETPAAAREASALFATVWGLELAASPMSPELLRALAHSGNYVVGAYDGDRMLGASAAFLAADPPATLHSHITGVISSHTNRSVGFAIKQHQREWARAHGLRAITWTFDPLVRRNAYFNIAKLGTRVVSYLPNFYGPMDDAINRADATDRLLVRWELDPGTVPAAAAPLDVSRATSVLDEAADGWPLTHEPDGASLLVCATPDDIAMIRSMDPERAGAWRLALRAALGGALTSGYDVIGVTRIGHYLLGLRRPRD